MKSLNTSIQGKRAGFTLIEILVSIAILAVIASLGLFISMDFFRSYSFRSEESVIVSVLQKARSESMNNIDQSRHGVHFITGHYVIFECPSICTIYPGSNSSDLIINTSYGSTISPPALPFDVIFEQLTGNCVTLNCSSAPLTITATDNGKTQDIVVNSEGRIDW